MIFIGNYGKTINILKIIEQKVAINLMKLIGLFIPNALGTNQKKDAQKKENRFFFFKRPSLYG